MLPRPSSVLALFMLIAGVLILHSYQNRHPPERQCSGGKSYLVYRFECDCGRLIPLLHIGGIEDGEHEEPAGGIASIARELRGNAVRQAFLLAHPVAEPRGERAPAEQEVADCQRRVIRIAVFHGKRM